jgi:uncharacterized membrane protein YqjE
MTSVPGSGGSHAVGDTGGRHGSVSDAIPPAEQVEGAHQTFDKGEVSSLGAIVADISSDLSTLMRQELALAKAEATETATRAGKGAGMLAGAAVFGLLAMGALTAALIALLDKAMATWVAALIVMALWAIVALVLAKAGQKALKSATPPAPQTVETVKEDIQWAKNPTGSAPR